MGCDVLTSQPTEEIEETMETGLIPLMEHRTYCTRKHNRSSISTFMSFDSNFKLNLEPHHYSSIMVDTTVAFIEVTTCQCQ